MDKEKQAFNGIIWEIQASPAEGLKQAEALKTAAVNYYTAFKDLHMAERAKIEQREGL